MDSPFLLPGGKSKRICWGNWVSNLLVG